MTIERINLIRKVGTVNINDDLAEISRESVVATSKYVTSGIWYWEVTLEKIDTYGYVGIGVASDSLTAYNNNNIIMFNNKYSSKIVIYNGSAVVDNLPFTMNEKDTVGVVLDVENKTIQFFFKNETSKKYSVSNLENFSPVTLMIDATVTVSARHNFGQNNFRLLDEIIKSINLNYPSSKILSYDNSKIVNIVEKILLKSNDKVYSIESEEKVYDLKMTSNTTPAPYVARGSSTINATTYDYFKAFDGNSSTYWVSNAIISNININFSTSKKVNKVSLTPRGDALTQAPKNFNIEASNDGTNWTILLKVENITDWATGVSKEFNLDKTFEYSQYRINILSNNGGTVSSLAEIVYGVSELILKEIPVESIENLIQYGEETAKNFSSVLTTKNYILQDGMSEDTDGLWRQELNRKPLSIKFE